MSAPLKNLSVLDFSTLLPGCYASMLLGDLGAHVTKIEGKDARFDLMKETPPKVDGCSVWYQVLNRNKEVVALNLKDPTDRDRAVELARRADVVLEGFRPQVMARLGLDYASLKEINPALVYCAITGYGQTGGYAQKAGHDINFLALSGINSFTADESPPLLSIQVADVCGGALYAVVAILTALLHRTHTGEGQYIDVSLLDTSIALATAPLAKFLAGGILPQHGDDLLNGGSFYGYYQTKDGRYLSVGAIEEKFRQTLAVALSLPHIADDPATREIIAARIKTKTLAEWTEIFKDKDCCVEANLNCAEMVHHEQCVAREIVTTVPAKHGKTQKQVAHPVKYSTFTPRYDFAGGTHDAT